MLEYWKKTIDHQEKIRFTQTTEYSPYCEASRNSVKENGGITCLSVNAYYRYSEIMEPLFINDTISAEWKNWLFDIYMHYLTILEWRKGITVQEYEIQKIRVALEKGEYGQDIFPIYRSLEREKKYYIAHMLFQQEKTRESISKFADVMVTVLQDGIVYKNRNQEKQVLFYINRAETQNESNVIQMICDLFLPIGYNLRVFRETHFGVMGKNQTMEIGEIELL